MKIKLIVLILFLSQVFSSFSFANSEIISARRGVATVILFGLGGAVLGLSTLSFYPRPQENLANISYGFLFGLIGGGVYIATQDNREESVAKKLGLDPFQEILSRNQSIHIQNMYSVSFEF